ncbi:MAG: leucine-rich repeat protein [Eubacterium sp.]|nr:leucine-rich repeat protein [Eubacterium sp.]
MKKCSKKFKTALVIILAIITAGSATLMGRVLSQRADFDRNAYRAELTEIYQEYNTNEALKAYKNGDKFAFARLLLPEYSGNSYNAYKCVVDKQTGFAVLQYKNSSDARRAYKRIKADGLKVDTESLGSLESQKGTFYPEGSEAVGSTSFLNKYAMDSDDVIVAIIDTGVMYDHAELAGRFYNTGYDYSPDGMSNAYYDTALAGKYYNHATFVSGIVADNTPDTVKLLPYKVVAFGESDVFASAIISSINDAVDRGASVINISIICSGSASSFKAALKNAVDNNVCVCASAGNNSIEVRYSYPAATEGAITVSSVEEDMQTFSDFSNYGSCIDFTAPGRRVVSTSVYKGSASHFTRGSGTSFSSPYVAALCADIKTVNKDMTKDDVCTVLSSFSKDLGDEGKDIYFGWGLVDISDIKYERAGEYSCKIPEGTLEITAETNFTKDSVPWEIFADKIKTASVSSGVTAIGDYTFYNMQNADFTLPSGIDSVGSFAFYNCKKLTDFTFDINCKSVKTGAFDGIENFVINGYRNTPAEDYAYASGVTFNALGCKHNYLIELFENENYALYTCTVCGDSYTGDYFVPEVVLSGACGESLNFSLDETGRLTLSGSGDMYDFSTALPPWSEYVKDIKTLSINNGVGGISAFAFNGCSNLCRIYLNGENENYSVEDNVLYSKDKKRVILLSKRREVYEMPDSVESFSPAAFVIEKGSNTVFNSRFNTINDLVYDNDGNIVLALPSYDRTTLEINDNIGISDYAFIYTGYPEFVDAKAKNITFGRYSLGFALTDTLTKNNVRFAAFDGATAVAYANTYGFEINTYNKGVCGDNIEWYYDIEKHTLTLSGSGAMTSYASAQEIPWYDYISAISEVVIGDDITTLSDYAFYGAEGIETLSLPCSVEVPRNDTVWYGCTGIKTLNLTLGSGRMSDCVIDGTTYYKNTPWNISRKSITAFNIDENILYVGKQCFRGCSALKEVTLAKCEEIAEEAFLACTKLDKFTLLNNACVIADYSLFSYHTSDYGIYSSPVMYAYSDSTARDYCDKFSANFVSLGCTHSRDVRLLEADEHPCCQDSYYRYYCLDCDSEFDEYIKNPMGHFVKGTLTAKNGTPLSSASVYIDGELASKTDENGVYIAQGILCGEHNIQLKKNDLSLALIDFEVDKSNVRLDISAPYGDYNGDSHINGRDLAYAKLNDINDYGFFDYGDTAGVFTFDSLSYAEQAMPACDNCRFEPVAGSDYRMNFIVNYSNESEFKATSYGFLYGVQMDEDMLTLEKADTFSPDGYRVRKVSGADCKQGEVSLAYGITTKTSWFGVRFFVQYTNGAINYTYYSDVYKYQY